MRLARFHVPAGVPAPIADGFAALISEHQIATQFSAAVLAEAGDSALHPALPGKDLTGLDFQTLDPEGSKDLDQAFFLERVGDGYRVWYAIADVAGFVRPDSLVDQEARRRGTTVYCPVARFPLHPEVLSESAASLLADGHPRPAAVWCVDLDADGVVTAAHVERAMVRSRAQLSYTGAQRLFETGQAGEDLHLLETVGKLREAQEIARGGISLNLPEQDIVVDRGAWTLSFRSPAPIEDWNAQLSLLTGNVAAQMMLDAGVGVLRTLPAAEPDAVDRLRHIAQGLGIAWAANQGYPDFVRGLDPSDPRGLAMMTACTALFRGAGYRAFTDGRPSEPVEHAALAMPYAHVTAPLRRLVDRFGTEVCLAVSAGQEPAAWVRSGLAELPGQMAQADQRSSGFERGVISLVEALVLQSKLGETLSGTVVTAVGDRGRVRFQDPAAEIEVSGTALHPGDAVQVRIDSVDLHSGTVAAALV